MSPGYLNSVATRASTTASSRGALVASYVWVIVALIAVQELASSAALGKLTVTRAAAKGESTADVVSGTAPAAATVTIRWTSFQGTGYTVTATAGAGGTWTTTIQDLAGKITVSTPGCPNKVAAVPPSFSPGVNTVITRLAVLPGSTATAGGQVFALAGGFTTIDTAVEYDSLSPRYGDLSGLVLAAEFDLTGIGSAGTLDFMLTGDQSYTVNLLPVWTSLAFSGDTISFAAPISGTASLAGVSSAFAGIADGTITFLEDNAEEVRFTFSLNSDFGPITGEISALGTSELVGIPIPTTSHWGLAILGLTLLCVAKARSITRGWDAS